MEESSVPFKQYFKNLSLRLYFWLVICTCAIIFGILGFFIGVRILELPFETNSALPLQSTAIPVPTNFPGGDNDTDYARIVGNFTTDTNYYEQLVVSVDSIQNGVKTNLDYDLRDITRPQVGVAYPFSFARLDPSKTYIVSASACTVNAKTYALECAKKISVSNCTGTVVGSNCIVTWQGSLLQKVGGVSFSIMKAQNPIPSPPIKKNAL